jgi:hypothetical protein
MTPGYESWWRVGVAEIAKINPSRMPMRICSNIYPKQEIINDWRKLVMLNSK